jgi:hypothetical protein
MRLFWFLLILPSIALSQPNFESRVGTAVTKERISEFCAVDGLSKNAPEISDFLLRLEDKFRERNSLKFSQFLFTKTRQSFLRRYVHEASFRQTLEKGQYNCLTGTALYAVLLDHFSIPYRIVETNYHIFLMVRTEEGEVLFEATDPLNGFVDNATEIEKRIERYRRNAPLQVADQTKKYYTYNVNLYRDVSFDEVKGLLHYNLSTEAYNARNFQSAILHLERTVSSYNSPRLYEFSTVLLLAVMESDLEPAVRQSYIAKVQSIRKRQLTVVASLQVGD